MTKPEFTLFTTCKPFRGPAAIHQRAALASWARLGPACEILVLGEESGAAGCSRELGLRHHPEIERSSGGTPRIDALFAAGERLGRGQILVYANADLLLAADLLQALRAVACQFPRFLALIRRWNVPAELFASLAEAAPPEQVTRARRIGAREPVSGGGDVFAFPRGFWRNALPPFAVGRGRWDSGLILAARRQRDPVVDLTAIATAVHPTHGYEHLRSDDGADSSAGEEILQNATLLGGAECVFSAVNATHRATAEGIQRYWPRHPAHAARRIATASALYPWLAPLVPLARLAGRVARWRGRFRESGRLPWHVVSR